MFAGFFKLEFAADDPEAVIEIISELGLSADNYQEYLSGDGVDAYEQSHEEAVEDQIFGVPLFVFNGEQFWGHDRIWLLEHVLKEAGLEKT